MSEFKLGDRVRLISSPTTGQNIGDEGVIESGPGYRVKVRYDSGEYFYEFIKDIELVKPESKAITVKTETRIQGGLYGIVEIFSHDGNLVNIEIKYNSCDAKELLEASQVLKQISEILQNNP